MRQNNENRYRSLQTIPELKALENDSISSEKGKMVRSFSTLFPSDHLRPNLKTTSIEQSVKSIRKWVHSYPFPFDEKELAQELSEEMMSELILSYERYKRRNTLFSSFNRLDFYNAYFEYFYRKKIRELRSMIEENKDLEFIKNAIALKSDNDLTQIASQFNYDVANFMHRDNVNILDKSHADYDQLFNDHDPLVRFAKMAFPGKVDDDKLEFKFSVFKDYFIQKIVRYNQYQYESSLLEIDLADLGVPIY